MIHVDTFSHTNRCRLLFLQSQFVCALSTGMREITVACGRSSPSTRLSHRRLWKASPFPKESLGATFLPLTRRSEKTAAPKQSTILSPKILYFQPARVSMERSLPMGKRRPERHTRCKEQGRLLKGPMVLEVEGLSTWLLKMYFLTLLKARIASFWSVPAFWKSTMRKSVIYSPTTAHCRSAKIPAVASLCNPRKRLCRISTVY
jgi:hypothetical protein